MIRLSMQINSNIWKLFLLFVLTFVLRFYLMPQNLFFGPEQGRDFLVVRDLVYERKLTLIGPKTDIDGIFHGPVYYYLVAVPFALGRGNPLVASAFIVLLHSSGTIFIYLLGKELFSNRVGLFSAILFVFSFGAVMYSRWLSHPALSIPFSVIFFFLLQRYLRLSKKYYLLAAAVMFGLLVQVEILNAVFMGVALFITSVLYRKKFSAKKKSYLLFAVLISVVVSFGWMVLFDLRHNFLISHRLGQLFRGEAGYHFPLTAAVKSALATYLNLFTKTITPPFVLIGIIGILASTAFLLHMLLKRQKQAGIILVWLFTPVLSIVLLRHETLEHFLTVSIGAMIVSTAVLVDRLWRRRETLGLGVLGVIMGFNIISWTKNIQHNRGITFQAAQPDLRYADQLRVIDEIYRRANGRQFEIQAYTIPYWFQDGWEYLFWYYGKQKYGYAPVEKKAPLLFVIVQDDPANEKFQKDWLTNTVANWGEEKDSFRSGILEVKVLQKQT